MELKLDLPPPYSTRTLTLFGRARLGLPYSDLLQEKKSEPSHVRNEAEAISLKGDIIVDRVSTVQAGGLAKPCSEKLIEEVEVQRNMCMVSNQNHKDTEPRIDKLAEEGSVDGEIPCGGSTRTFCSARSSDENVEGVDAQGSFSCIGSSKALNVSLKKLYRSMNVPVPRPLPSLVELMGASKRVKLGSESITDRLKHRYNSAHCLSP